MSPHPDYKLKDILSVEAKMPDIGRWIDVRFPVDFLRRFSDSGHHIHVGYSESPLKSSSVDVTCNLYCK